MAAQPRPTLSASIVTAAAEAKLAPPTQADLDAQQGAQVVLAADSAARAGAMGVYETLEQNELLRDAGYLQLGLHPDDPSNELTDPEPLPPIPTPPATTAPVNVDVPFVSQSGSDLMVTLGNWTGEPTSYSYAWKLDGADIGVNAATVAVQSGDVGKSATCVVTAVNAIGSTAAPESNAVVVA